MVKITIRYDGQDEVVEEGNGLIYGMNCDKSIKGGVVGEFCVEDLLNVRKSLNNNIIKAVGEFAKEGN